MLTFSQFINEGFRSDIPNEDWLKMHQEDAENTYGRWKGITGKVTGYFDHLHEMNPSILRNVPGLNGEHHFRESPNSKRIDDTIGHPSNFDSQNHPIMIGVNHRGRAYVIEGNHRLGYAIKHRIPVIHAEIKYYNGGERVNGPFHPSKLHHFKIGI